MDLYFVTRKVYASRCNIIVCDKSSTEKFDQISSLISATGRQEVKERGGKSRGKSRDAEKIPFIRDDQKTLNIHIQCTLSHDDISVKKKQVKKCVESTSVTNDMTIPLCLRGERAPNDAYHAVFHLCCKNF